MDAIRRTVVQLEAQNMMPYDSAYAMQYELAFGSHAVDGEIPEEWMIFQ